MRYSGVNIVGEVDDGGECGPGDLSHMGEDFEASGNYNTFPGSKFIVQDGILGLMAQVELDWYACTLHTNDYAVGEYTIGPAIYGDQEGAYCQDFFGYRIYDTTDPDEAFLEQGGLPLYVLREDDPTGSCMLTISERSSRRIAGTIECTDIPELLGGGNDAYGVRLDSITVDFDVSGLQGDVL